MICNGLHLPCGCGWGELGWGEGGWEESVIFVGVQLGIINEEEHHTGADGGDEGAPSHLLCAVLECDH